MERVQSVGEESLSIGVLRHILGPLRPDSRLGSVPQEWGEMGIKDFGKNLARVRRSADRWINIVERSVRAAVTPPTQPSERQTAAPATRTSPQQRTAQRPSIDRQRQHIQVVLPNQDISSPASERAAPRLPTRLELVTSIADTVSDYAAQPGFKVTPNHVNIWASQFDQPDQMTYPGGDGQYSQAFLFLT